MFSHYGALSWLDLLLKWQVKNAYLYERSLGGFIPEWTAQHDLCISMQIQMPCAKYEFWHNGYIQLLWINKWMSNLLTIFHVDLSKLLK